MIKNLDNKKYAIDMSKLMAWVSETPSSEKNITTLITETFPLQTDDGDDIASKEISESKTTLNEVMNNIRYDFAKQLFTPLIAYSENHITTSVDLTFAQKLCFNTLLKEGIIIEI